MNIAFFTDNFFPQRDGVVTSLTNSAIELGRRGHSVMILTPKPHKLAPKSFAAKNVTIAYVHSIPALLYPEYRFGMLLTPKLRKSLRLFKPDIVHFHTPWGMGFSAHLAAKAFDVPLVGTNHIYLTKENAQSLCIFPGARLMEKQIAGIGMMYIKAFYDQCDLRLAPSKTLINGLRTSGYKKPFVYLPNGVPLASVRELTATEKAEYKKRFKLKDKVVLHFGRLATEKSVDDLLRSFALLRKRLDTVSLLIIGDGPAKASLMRLARKLDIEDDVVFAGSIAHEELLSSGIIGVADCFVTASRTENQPMVVLEAMSHSLPIVGVREAGMIDLISDNGFLAEPDDLTALAGYIEQLLTHPALAKKMGVSAAAFAEQFSIRKTTATLLSLYEKVMKEKPKHAKKSK